MAKNLFFTFLLLFAIAEIKAQTYCYRCYKVVGVDESGVQQLLPIGISYQYFTYQGDLLFENYYPSKTNLPKMAWKHEGIVDNGHLLYYRYYKNIFGKYNELVVPLDKNRILDICYVLKNRDLICIVENGIYSYYEKCDDRNCK